MNIAMQDVTTVRLHYNEGTWTGEPKHQRHRREMGMGGTE